MTGSRTSYDTIVLAGDIGGTNTNLALIGKKGGTFTIVAEGHYRTREESSLHGPLRRFLEDARRKGAPSPELCCLSAAGPVIDERITLTNAPWGIDGPAVARDLGLPTRIINDFTAVSYGVLLVDRGDPEEATRLPHSDGSDPEPDPAGLKLVVGAGTGLGVGFIAKFRDRVAAFPSEGGHITLPAWDEETRGFQRWLGERYGFVPGAEPGVSGQGIGNLFAWLAERAGGRLGPEAAAILEAPEPERPALVAAAAATDPVCARAMELFVELYARVCSDLAASFLPYGGLYLAGGIAAKNEARFLEGTRFMGAFEKSYAKHIRLVLARVPVMIVKDYSVSLYGAANAAVMMA